MKRYEFSIIASGLSPAEDDALDRFYDAGCDDATVSCQLGQTSIAFAREAASLEGAIASAVVDVTKAGAQIERVERQPLPVSS